MGIEGQLLQMLFAAHSGSGVYWWMSRASPSGRIRLPLRKLTWLCAATDHAKKATREVRLGGCSFTYSSKWPRHMGQGRPSMNDLNQISSPSIGRLDSARQCSSPHFHGPHLALG